MLGRLGEAEQAVQRRHEVVGHRAAQAAIGQLDDAVLRAVLDAAPFEDLAVDADIAELVDDHGKTPPAGVLQHMADQGRLPRAEEAGDDGAGRFCKAHELGSMEGMVTGGTRATTPERKHCGRSRQATMPFSDAA
jgi:hypothetical protein